MPSISSLVTDIYKLAEGARSPLPNDFHWLVGLLEGEGCFTEYKVGTSQRPVIHLNMCDEDVVRRVASLFGSSCFRKKTKTKDQFVTKVSGKRALSLMKLLCPHMSGRRAERINQLVQKYDAN